MNRAYTKVTNLIIEKLKSGVIPWQKGWKPAHNLITGHEYTGINRLILAGEGSHFLTYNQAKKLSGHIKKGSKGHPVVYLGHRTVIEEDEETQKKAFKDVSFLKYYTVFNYKDAQLPEKVLNKYIKQRETTPPNITAENIIHNYKDAPRIEYLTDTPGYCPGTDTITIPPSESYDSDDRYYSSLFHELAHSTGHQKRLNRSGIVGIKHHSYKYAKEELIAELGAAFLCWKCNLKKVIDNQTSYIKGWLEALANDHKLIVSAASQAEKATNYILEKQLSWKPQEFSPQRCKEIISNECGILKTNQRGI